jgi:hypothetical protein
MDNDIARLRVTMAVAGDAQNRSRRPAFRRKAEPSLALLRQNGSKPQLYQGLIDFG